MDWRAGAQSDAAHDGPARLYAQGVRVLGRKRRPMGTCRPSINYSRSFARG